MKIERYKNDWYKNFYDPPADNNSWREIAEVPDELYKKYQDAAKAMSEVEIEMDAYFK